MLYKVVKDWTATYDAPIALCPGDPVELTGRRDIWDGHVWLWAKGVDGAEGWIPDSLVMTVNGKHVAGRVYSAMELTCERGQVVTAIEKTHGWVLCRTTQGRIGWVPQSHLEVHAAADSD